MHLYSLKHLEYINAIKYCCGESSYDQSILDSIKIIRNINDLKLFKNKYLSGSSGYLQLDEFNKIRRDLIIIKFKNGIAKKVSF